MSAKEARLLGLAETLGREGVKLDNSFFESQGSRLMEFYDQGWANQEELKLAAEISMTKKKGRQKKIPNLHIIKKMDISTAQGGDAFDTAALILYFREIKYALLLGVSLGHLSTEEADQWRERFRSGHPWTPVSPPSPLAKTRELPINPLSFSPS